MRVHFMETKDLNLKSLAFKVTVVSYVCAILCLVLAVYFIGPQLSGNTSPLWNVQLSIGVWALLFGFFVSAIGLKFVFVPHILALAQKEGQDTCRELGEKLEENHTGTLKTSKCSRTSIELRGKTFKCRFRIGRERWVKVKVKVRGKKLHQWLTLFLCGLVVLGPFALVTWFGFCYFPQTPWAVQIPASLICAVWACFWYRVLHECWPF